MADLGGRSAVSSGGVVVVVREVERVVADMVGGVGGGLCCSGFEG